MFVELRGGKVYGEPWWCWSLEWVQWILPCVSPQQESMPFAVVGSDKEYQVNGKRVLGRKTPWGIIEGKKTSCLWELKVLSADHSNRQGSK